jgi:hypothetical protein
MKLSLIQVSVPAVTSFHQVQTFSSATSSLTVFTLCVLLLELISFISIQKDKYICVRVCFNIRLERNAKYAEYKQTTIFFIFLSAGPSGRAVA